MKNKTAGCWMVVDDEKEAMDAVARLLSELSDAEIYCYPSPWQALDAVAAAPNTFEFIVTDLEMPGMNGVDFRRHLQSISPEIKVLLTTATGTFTDEIAREQGFCGLLCKPFSIEALKAKLMSTGAINA